MSDYILLVRPAHGGVAHVGGATCRALRSTEADVTEVVLGEPSASAWRALGSAWRTRHQLRAADSVHVECGRTTAAPLWFAAAAVAVRRDVTVVAHDLPVIVGHPGAALVPLGSVWRSRLAYRVIAPLVDRPLRSWVMRRAGGVGVFSDEAGRSARRWGARRVTVLPHGADPALPAPLPSRGTAVVFAGIVAPDKGVEALLEAWRRIGAESPVPLVIAGECVSGGADWLAAVREIGDGMPHPPVWRSGLDDGAFQRQIADAAVVVLPYRTSNPVSGVAIRAVVQGRPVVGTRVPALESSVEHGVTGLLGPVDDAGALADHLRALLRSPEMRDRFGAAAADRAESRHTWLRHVTALRRLYALSRRSP